MKKVGPLIVGVAVIKRGNKFLLCKRRSKLKIWRKWEVPGGIVNFGESLEDAIKREVKEEIGVEVELVKPIDFFFTNIWKLKKKRIHVFLVGYLCRIKRGKPKPCDREIEKVKWFSIEEVKKLDCLPGSKEFVLKAANL